MIPHQRRPADAPFDNEAQVSETFERVIDSVLLLEIAGYPEVKELRISMMSASTGPTLEQKEDALIKMGKHESLPHTKLERLANTEQNGSVV